MPLFRDRSESRPAVGRILVATDRSETADYAVRWAAEMAERYGAELILLQVGEASVEALQQYAEEVAGERGRARVTKGDDPALVICDVGEQEDVDVIVVGNLGMSGRKEFLLGNVPNRVSHNTDRTVVIVNTAAGREEAKKKRFGR